MTRQHHPDADVRPNTINGPTELLTAVPYLLGFHPHDSLVLIGLANARLIVTARIDLPGADPRTLEHTIAAMARGGTAEIITVAFTDTHPHDPRAREDGAVGTGSHIPLTFHHAAQRAAAAAVRAAGLRLTGQLATWNRLWCTVIDHDCSGARAEPRCCSEPSLLPDAPTPFHAEAVYRGLVPATDRDALADRFDRNVDPTAMPPSPPQPDAATDREEAARSIQELLAAAHAASTSTPPAVSVGDVARWGQALTATTVRDALWLAVDDDSLVDGELWLQLARTLPAPYDAAPLFLYAWHAWRHGDGALARIAADRALVSDPDYSAAQLLIAALDAGLAPHAVPPLRCTT